MEEYSGALARFYDVYFRGLEGDVAFYVNLAQKAGSPILELGCGTGRTLIPMAAAGVEVVGLDNAPQMLAQCQERIEQAPAEVRKRIRLLPGTMQEGPWEGEFSLISAPYRTFQHLLTPIDQTQALEHIYQHLQPGGVFACNTFDPQGDPAFSRQGSAPLTSDGEFADPASGNRVQVWYCRHYDLESQILEQDLLFEAFDPSGTSVGRYRGRLTLRYAFRWEMEYLLELCGFEVEALYGDFNGGAYPGYGEQIWLARKV